MEYFAIRCRVSDLEDKIDTFYKRLNDIGHTRKLQKSCYFYFGQGNASSYINRSGSQLQNSSIVVNDYRSILQHAVTLVTSNRPAYDVRATNTDYKSQTQAILGEQILDYYLKEKKLEKHLKNACGQAVRYGESFIGLSWDVHAGNLYTVDEMGNPQAEGDIEYKVYDPLSVIRDIDNTGNPDWCILRDKINKYELAAKIPEHAEHITNLTISKSNSSEREIDFELKTSTNDETDMIYLYTFYHRKSTVLPEGKVVFFVDDLKLLESPLPYTDMPVYRIAAENLDGTCLGYTVAFDLLGIQESSDKLYSALVSNNLTFARQIIQAERDNDIDVSSLSDGLMFIESDKEIKPVNLTKSAPETYEFIKTMQAKMQELSGMNEVIRGTPSPNLRSGNALVFIAAQAITYNSGLERSYNELIEDVGTATIRMLKDFATSPRFVAVVGKYKKAFMKEFQGSDLENIDRITVEQQGAVMRTTAGKLQLAENLLQNKIITRAEQYLAVLDTGRLEPLVEAEQAELLLIRHENEMLSEGKPAVVVATDAHDLHIREHKAVISNPESRAVAAVVEATLAHIQQHFQVKRSTDPELLMITGTQPSKIQAPPNPAAQGPSLESQQMQPPGPQVPDNMPNRPSLPQGADQRTQAADQQMQQLEGGVE